MLQAVSEYGVGSSGRDLGVQLAYRALRQLKAEPAAAFLWATGEYNLEEAVNALQVLLGDVVVWGGTVRRVWNEEGLPARGMVLVVLAGEGLGARGWWLDDLQSARQFDELPSHLGAWFVAIEAMQPRLRRWIQSMANLPAPLVGGLMGGRFQVGRPTLIGGRASSSGGGAFLALSGVRLGLGWGSGWASSGLWAEVTASHGEWVRALNGKPAAEVLAEIFGEPSSRWPYAPLREFVRLYPLGLRHKDGSWDMRAPLHVEADGSLRMTLTIPRGRRVYWMVGGLDDAARAAADATANALRALDEAKPAIAVVLLDWAWYYLFTAHETLIIEQIRRILGHDVPVVGVYTYGQLVRAADEGAPQLLHNHLAIALLASA